MKKNRFFVMILLGAVMLSGTMFGMETTSEEPAQSWASRIASALSRMSGYTWYQSYKAAEAQEKKNQQEIKERRAKEWKEEQETKDARNAAESKFNVRSSRISTVLGEYLREGLKDAFMTDNIAAADQYDYFKGYWTTVTRYGYGEYIGSSEREKLMDELKISKDELLAIEKRVICGLVDYFIKYTFLQLYKTSNHYAQKKGEITKKAKSDKKKEFEILNSYYIDYPSEKDIKEFCGRLKVNEDLYSQKR